MTAPGIGWSVDRAQAFALMGYVSGIATQIKTPVYIKSVLHRTHALLAAYFDLWMDDRAKNYPHQFMHVYEWPTAFRAYEQTVGNPDYRLWDHFLDDSSSANAIATFKFRESERPVPVNPILTAQGVKSGIHVFGWKATAMEYGAPITVVPKLARFLAYVADGSPSGHGDDGDDSRHLKPGTSVMFSKGPVHFTAGGDATHMKFTTSFIEWWSTMASHHWETDIAPGLERDLISTAKINRTVKVGTSNRRKIMNIQASAAADEKVFAEAAYKAIGDMADNARRYIEEAAAVRKGLHG